MAARPPVKTRSRERSLVVAGAPMGLLCAVVALRALASEVPAPAEPVADPTPTADSPRAQPPAAAADDPAAYALGILTARGIEQLALSDEEWASFMRALRDHRDGRAPLDLAAGLPPLDRFQRARAAATIERETAANEAFLAEAAAEATAERLPSGVIVRVLEPGDGASAQPTDKVTLRFTGWLRDGVRFDSSDVRGAPAEYTLDRMIPCWSQPLLRARIGARLRITCPPALAYGEQGVPPLIPPAAALRFELELLAAVPRDEAGGR